MHAGSLESTVFVLVEEITQTLVALVNSLNSCVVLAVIFLDCSKQKQVEVSFERWHYELKRKRLCVPEGHGRSRMVTETMKEQI